MGGLARTWRRWLAGALAAAAGACVHPPSSPYSQAAEALALEFKEVGVPLPPGTAFQLSQGPFGRNSHHDPGEEYKWDLDVPFGTPVVAAQAGVVLSVSEPPSGGLCNPSFAETPHTLKVLHSDGTVAQYVHVDSRVRVGQRVRRGEALAVTALNGFLCQPQLCFSVYRSAAQMHGAASPETLPLRFAGIPGGRLLEGQAYVAPGR